MSPLGDDELREQLGRRARSAPLDHVQRVELIESIHEQVVRGGQSAAGWRDWRWLSAGAALVVIVMIGVLGWPRLANNPSATQPPNGSGLVLSAVQLANVASARNSIGQVVLADARLADDVRTDRCVGHNPCFTRVVAGTYPALQVDLGVYADSSLPDGQAVIAFQLQDGYVTYLGQASLNDGGAWTVSQLSSSAATLDPSVLYPVDGWLVEAYFMSCPAPPDLASSPDFSYYCQGSWLTEDRTYSVTARSSNHVSSLAAFPGGLNVQNGSYQQFADNPVYGDLGAEPRNGTYLVRLAGCPTYRMGDCPVWKMYARLSALAATVPSPSPSSSPSPSPSPTPSTAPQSGVALLSEAELIALAADPSPVGAIVVSDARINFEPSPTQFDVPGQHQLEAIGTIGSAGGPQVTVVAYGWPDTTFNYHAFRVLDSNRLEYLGPVDTSTDDGTWTVPQALAIAPPGESSTLYAVSGWLMQTAAVPCPAPMDMEASEDYWCGGSWLAAEPPTPPTDGSISLQVPDALHVQWSAYHDFAVDPQVGVNGGEPRLWTYLVRPFGCPANVMGDCPVWQMIGRLDLQLPSSPLGTPSASPTPPASGVVLDQRGVPIYLDGQRVFEGPEIGDQVANATDDTPFLIVGSFNNSGWPDCPQSVKLALLCGPGSAFQSDKPWQLYQTTISFERPKAPVLATLFVLKVHVHDQTAATTCPAIFLAACEHALVLDAIVWPAPAP
jgi:hypothetical protein